MSDKIKYPEPNRDPITHAPGAHPLGVGVGAAGGAAAGAALGSAVGGPVGTLVGGAAGAVVGGLAGKGAAEAVNPTREDEYWRENYRARPYFAGEDYEMYQPAFKYGWESYHRYGGKTFEEVEMDLGQDWEKTRDAKTFSWDKARHAARDAWQRVERSTPREKVGDGS